MWDSFTSRLGLIIPPGYIFCVLYEVSTGAFSDHLRVLGMSQGDYVMWYTYTQASVRFVRMLTGIKHDCNSKSPRYRSSTC